MKLRNIIGGNLYVDHKDRIGRCSAPFSCHGTSSGFCVYWINAFGNQYALTDDHSLRPATMREQRDFWKLAFELLVEEGE